MDVELAGSLLMAFPFILLIIAGLWKLYNEFH
jgi:hypothetical protein